MMSFTAGSTLRMFWVSVNALSRSSSLGRTEASVKRECRAANRCLMHAIHSFWFSALNGPVIMANWPPLGRRRSASSVSALAIPPESPG